MKNRNGFIISEIVIGMTLMLAVTAGFITTMHAFKKVAKVEHFKEQCLSAGLAQLDNFTVAGKAVEEAKMEELWPKVECEIRITDGANEWEGFSLITVKTSGKVGKKEIDIEQKRYVVKNTFLSESEIITDEQNEN